MILGNIYTVLLLLLARHFPVGLFAFFFIDWWGFFIYSRYMWISNTSSHSIICLSYSLHGAFWRTEVSALFFFKSYLNFSWLFTFPYKYGDEFVNFHFNCLHGMYRLIWEKIDIFTSSLIELFYPPPWHIFYFQSWVNSIFVVSVSRQ